MEKGFSGKVIDIAPSGDLVLVVGPEEQRIRVHSLYLKDASRPMAAMLSQDWKESKMTEVPLPEDDAAAMEFLCRALHHKLRQHEPRPTPQELVQILRVADKYDFLAAVDAALPSLLLSGNHGPVDNMRLLAIAFWSRNGAAFKALSKKLVTEYGGPFIDLDDPDVAAINPGRLLYYLEQQRGTINMKVANILIKLPRQVGCSRLSCDWQEKQCYKYGEYLNNSSLLPTQITCLAEAARKFGQGPVPLSENSDSRCATKPHKPLRYGQVVKTELAQLEQQAGLCLECVEAGEAQAIHCRGKHKKP